MVAKSVKNVFKINFHVFLKKKIFFRRFFFEKLQNFEKKISKIKGVFQILNLRVFFRFSNHHNFFCRQTQRELNESYDMKEILVV